MAGIDYSGIDPWPSIGNVPEISGPSTVLSAVGGDWLGMGLKLLGSGLFGGSTKVSGAASGSAVQMNTSGWALGEDSEAQGAGLEAAVSSVTQIPWWVWIGGAAVLIIAIKKGK